jgi:hypothetical protein
MMWAQEEPNEYLPFVELGKLWHVVHSDAEQGCHFDQFMLSNEKLTEDATGETWFFMYRNGEKLMVDNKYILFREADSKVYYICIGTEDVTMPKEYLFFDYSLKAGDTYETYSLEYQMMVKYEVLSVSDFTEGPEVYYEEKRDSMAVRSRYLRKWVVQSEIEKELCLDPKTWIEGVGSLEGPLANLYDTHPSLEYLAYVENSYRLYLPFSFYDVVGKFHGCDLPKGEASQLGNQDYQLTYELEGDRLHVYGKVALNCGTANYAYFIEEATDDPLVHKLHFEIQDVGPAATCYSLFATNFYVPGFDPNLNYIVVDNYGDEHPVINKTPQMAYRPFIEEGKVWKVGGAESGNPVNRVEYYYFDGDTIVNGKTCKQMMRQRFVSPNHPNYAIFSQWPSLSYVGAWYEEDKKVYFCKEKSKEFNMMYDFSLDANETFQVDNGYVSYVIGPRETGGIKGFKGVYRDIMWASEQSPYPYNTTWLEGVGNIDGPMYSVYLGKEGHALFLMSCTVGDEVIYFNDEYEDGATPVVMEAPKVRFDFTHTVKTQPRVPKKKVAEKSLYGEYNTQQLDINLNPLNETYQVRITDETGKVVYEKSINAGNIVGLNIDISAFTEGCYTVSVENSHESFTGEFNSNTTGIEEIRSRNSELSGHYIYDLQGRKINAQSSILNAQLPKGIYIQNGKKVVVR